MLNITNAEASANILRFADEGRLTQGYWHSKAEDGRDIACLLGSIHPSVTRASQCNGDLMPMWLAALTPVLFDGILTAEIVSIARRYGALIGRGHALSLEAWGRVLSRFLIRTIDEAVDAARPVSEGKSYWPAIDVDCNQTKSAFDTGEKADLREAARAAEASAPRVTATAWADAASAAR